MYSVLALSSWLTTQSSEHSLKAVLLGVVVGLAEPPQGVAEVGFGIQDEGKPFCAGHGVFGIDARLFLRALQQFWRHGLDAEDERIGIPDGTRDGQGGEDLFAAIEAAQAEHRA